MNRDYIISELIEFTRPFWTFALGFIVVVVFWAFVVVVFCI